MEGTTVNGFYVGYFTGSAGEGMAMLMLHNGTLTGVDAAGTRVDGTYVKQFPEN